MFHKASQSVPNFDDENEEDKISNDNTNKKEDERKVTEEKDNEDADIWKKMKIVDFSEIYKITEGEDDIRKLIMSLKEKKEEARNDSESKGVKLHPLKEEFVPSTFNPTINCIIF